MLRCKLASHQLIWSLSHNSLLRGKNQNLVIVRTNKRNKMWRNFLRKTQFCSGQLQFLLWRRGLSSSASGEPASRFAAVWGNGDYGRLGVGSLESQWRPKPIHSSSFHHQSLKSIACGGAHTLFLTGPFFFLINSALWVVS